MQIEKLFAFLTGIVIFVFGYYCLIQSADLKRIAISVPTPVPSVPVTTQRGATPEQTMATTLATKYLDLAQTALKWLILLSLGTGPTFAVAKFLAGSAPAEKLSAAATVILFSVALGGLLVGLLTLSN